MASVLDPSLAEVLRPGAEYVIADGVARVAIDTDATLAAWDEVHLSAGDERAEDDVFTQASLALIRHAWRGAPDGRFLELGCGEMRTGAALAAEGAEAYGLDFSYSALAAARRRLLRLGQPVRLVQADIRATPFADGVFDAVFGGGVIEHVRELDDVLAELRRIVRPDGVTVNTVPYLSLGALTYRQIWGNIPAVPGLRHAAELVHLRLLRGRHLRFGYERSYPLWMLRRAYRAAGFSRVQIEWYDVPLVFEYLPERLRKPARRLARRRLFWPMVAVTARP